MSFFEMFALFTLFIAGSTFLWFVVKAVVLSIIRQRDKIEIARSVAREIEERQRKLIEEALRTIEVRRKTLGRY